MSRYDINEDIFKFIDFRAIMLTTQTLDNHYMIKLIEQASLPTSIYFYLLHDVKAMKKHA